MNFINKIWGKICYRLFNIYDWYWDRKICGCSLVKFVDSPWRKSKGSTGTGPTHYMSLDKIFEGSDFHDTDNFIDVGCGKGRILAYAIRQKFKGNFTGIELNPTIAEYAQKWVRKYPSLKVISGDAFQYDFNPYNIIFLARPFEPWAFQKFIPKLECELTHPVTFYYWVDQQSGKFLYNRPGWKCLRRGVLYRKFFIFNLHKCPQGFSVWDFDPAAAK